MTGKPAIVIGFIFILGSPLMAQDTIAFRPGASYGFIQYDSNYIHHNEYMESLYSKLVKLRGEKNSTVNILHIGDSHIQADYLTHTIRTLLQQEFGNAGLGLTFTGRAANTNESQQIYSASKGEWVSNKISLTQSHTTGISGVGLKTKTAGSSILIKATAPQYSFNEMTLFFQKDFNHYQINLKDSTGRSLAVAGAFTHEVYSNASKIILPYPVSQIQLETYKTLPSQNQFVFYGVSLEKSSPGVRYHISGINGSRFRHFIASQELIQQTSALNADLIIISLGTNEAVDHPSMDPKLSNQINSLISELKKVNPGSVILLTTPADFFKRKTRRNPGVQLVRTKIIEAANTNNLPYWDLYHIGGGNHSADRWTKKELLQADGIHFTKKGYVLQGELLYEALIKGVNEYVRNRPSKTR